MNDQRTALWRRVGLALRAATAATLLLLALAPRAAAHERWFVDDGRLPARFGRDAVGVTLLALAAMGAAVGIAWAAERALRRCHACERPYGVAPERLGAWLPPLLAAHAAIPLLVAGVNRHLFAPHLDLPRSLGGGLLALAQILVALSFLYGAFARAGAILLALTGLAGMAYFGPALVLEQRGLLGVAAFLAITGRGAFAVDALLGRGDRPDGALVPYAVPALRALTGGSLIVLGFTEKLWNVDLARAFLRAHGFNVTAATPLPLTDDQFILGAGLVEVALGALLIAGRWPRAVPLLALVPFNLSVPFFGWSELVGHLPIFGALVALLVAGADRLRPADLRPAPRPLPTPARGVRHEAA